MSSVPVSNSLTLHRHATYQDLTDVAVGISSDDSPKLCHEPAPWPRSPGRSGLCSRVGIWCWGCRFGIQNLGFTLQGTPNNSDESPRMWCHQWDRLELHASTTAKFTLFRNRCLAHCLGHLCLCLCVCSAKLQGVFQSARYPPEVLPVCNTFERKPRGFPPELVRYLQSHTRVL